MKGVSARPLRSTDLNSPTPTAQLQRKMPSHHTALQILQLQKQLGNRAVSQLLRARAQTAPTIQRAIDPDQVARCKALLQLPEGVTIKILQVPLNTPISTKVSAIGNEYKSNTEELDGLELCEIMRNKTKDQLVAESVEEHVPEQYLNDALLTLADSGGAAYIAARNLILIGPNTPERDLLHEMGHLKQDKVMDFRGDNSTVKLLEYHNVLLHENLDLTELRVSYDRSLSRGDNLTHNQADAAKCVDDPKKMEILNSKWDRLEKKIVANSEKPGKQKDLLLFKDIKEILEKDNRYNQPKMQALIKNYIYHECYFAM